MCQHVDMVCLHCSGKTSVTNSRPQQRSNQVWRRRQCRKCNAVFTTTETAQYGGAWAVRGKSGHLSPFSRDKLFLSLYKSCGHRKTALNDAGALADTVIKKLAGLVSGGKIESKAITQVVQVALNRFDKAASSHYQAFHRV
jgi:transcriptional regulator NrdR family protein